jgi:hypothetical protein
MKFKKIGLILILTLLFCYPLTAQNSANNRFHFPKSPYEAKSSQKFSILGTTKFTRNNKVFPKTKTNNSDNSLFRGQNFRVNDVFKQDKNIGFQPKATQGNKTNDRFKKPPKSINQDNIPPELLKLYKDQQETKF